MSRRPKYLGKHKPSMDHWWITKHDNLINIGENNKPSWIHTPVPWRVIKPGDEWYSESFASHKDALNFVIKHMSHHLVNL